MKSSPGLGTTVMLSIPLVETRESIQGSTETLPNV
jgi:hypothetical protein